MHGMAGGALLVGGDAGDRLGDRMRRGLIAVRGTAGDFAAQRMIGGTISLGDGVRRLGRLRHAPRHLVLTEPPASGLPTFADNGTHDLPWLRLLERQLAGTGLGRAPGPARRVRRLTGCVTVGGKGEILLSL